jgi:hypothetical protein
MVGVLVLASASSMSACIIPVAPDFQDPPQDPQLPPSFVNGSAMPAFGTLVLVTPQEFRGAVNNPAAVSLWYRAVLDYPEHPTSLRQVQPQTPIASNTFDFTLSCGVNPDVTVGTQHELTLIVADQQFDLNNAAPEALLHPGNYIESYWHVIMSCPGATQ